MKKQKMMPLVLLVAQFYLLKIVGTVFHLLEDIPVPDFNNEYDSTML